jgi:hypothetical protein
MRSNVKRAKLAIISLYIIAASTFLCSLNYIVTIYVIFQHQKGDELTIDQYETILIFFTSATVFYALSYVLCMVLFILWFTRAYRNLQVTLPKSKFPYRYWLASVVWFVPIWNLFGPYRIATILFDKTEDYLISEDKMLRYPNYDIVKGTWWALWIISAILIRLSVYHASRDAYSIPANVGAFVGFILSMCCALVGAQMIKNYSKMERLMNELGRGENSPTAIVTDDGLLDSGI